MGIIRPAKNQNTEVQKNDISTVMSIPEDVSNILQASCYDCHSNYTTYPWFDEVQPVYWWVNNHIEEGKHHLNFSEWATYTPKRQAHKMHEIAEQVEEGEMTLRVAKMLALKLRALGARVSFVRQKNEPVTPFRPDDFKAAAREVLAAGGT